MPLFDLGHDLKVSQSLGADLENAYRMSRRILESYGQQGYTVRFDQEREFTELQATFSDRDGTRITAAVKVREAGSARSQLEIRLTGKVYVGGMKGALASDSKVQSVAKDMLLKEIKKAMRDNGLTAALHVILQREQIYAYHQQQAGRTLQA